jgi:hypothetical protein
MKRSRLYLPLMIAVLVVIFGLGMAQSANACGGFRCWLIFPDGSSLHGTCHVVSQIAADHPGSMVMHMGETTITSLGERKALVTVSGYAATEMDVSCADSLSAVPGLRSVDSTAVLNAETGKPLPESPRYLRNKLTGPGFTDQANTEGLGDNTRYFGFFSKIRRPVPDDTPLIYVFEVTLKAGVSVADFAKSLGTYGVVGTARANSDGSLNSEHIHLRPLSLTPISVVDLSQ